MSGRLVVQLSSPKDKWRSWLLVVGGFLPGKRSEPSAIIIIVRIILKQHSPLPGNLARLCPHKMSGAGPIFRVFYMSNSLLAPAFPKERQLRRYADFLIKHSFMTLCSVSTRWQNEDDVAAQFVGFLQQFLEIFKELKGKKFYATGESVSTRFFKDAESILTAKQYAGMYVPCK